MGLPRVRVVAAAVFDTAGRVLIAERPVGKHMAGWWEFPGGKVMERETDAAALVRELGEELGIEARAEREIMTLSHRYADRVVDLVLWHATVSKGVPSGLDGQKIKWVDCDALDSERLLEADRPFIAALQLISSPAT